MKDSWKKFLNGKAAFKVKKEDANKFLKECDQYDFNWFCGEMPSHWSPIINKPKYCNLDSVDCLYFELVDNPRVFSNKLVFHDKSSDVSSAVIHDYKEEANNPPNKLIVNFDEVYDGNEWWYSYFDHLLLSGRKKLTSKWSYSDNVRDNDIFKVARDAIDHSRREMAKTPDKSITEIYDSLTDEQKELVHYLVSADLNERNKGE